MFKIVIEKIMKLHGFSNFTASFYSEKIYDELFGNEKNNYSLKEKIWAYRKGFTAAYVKLMNINMQNYMNYISIVDYLKLDPMDKYTKRLIDGKLVIPYTIGGRFKKYLPKYYCYIDENSNIIPMEDNCVSDYKNIEDYLVKLLSKVNCLAIKKYTGTGGENFYKVERKNTNFEINGKKVDNLNSFSGVISKQFLITEWIEQCDEFNKIWENSSATLRIVVVNEQGIPHVLGAYVRIGTKESKGASNMCAGGIALPFDYDSGKYQKYGYRYLEFCKNGECQLDRHPDSNYCFGDSKVPHLDKIHKLVDDICGYLTVHTYFGFDIIVSNNCVKICEINSQPAMNLEQRMFFEGGGIWNCKDEYVIEYFKNKLKINNKRR